MSVLSEYKVQVFFNFEGTYETSFDNLATTGVDKYIEKTRILEDQKYSEYLVSAIPNFTIIPKDKSGVVLDFKMKYEDETGVALPKEKEDLLKFRIEGVYIDAFYVAAGIVAAYQCPSYLKGRFNNVSPVYPGVRFDIEAEAKKYGGEWGGRWNFYDSPHFQFRFGKTWEVYLKEYNAVGKK